METFFTIMAICGVEALLFLSLIAAVDLYDEEDA